MERVGYSNRNLVINADDLRSIVGASENESSRCINLEKNWWLINGCYINVVYTDTNNKMCEIKYLIPHTKVTVKLLCNFLSSLKKKVGYTFSLPKILTTQDLIRSAEFYSRWSPAEGLMTLQIKK